MMDVREKLVELLDDMQRSGTGYFGSAIENKKIADYLISHGVTVQEWIPVTEMLPEPFVPVLACIPSEEPLPTVHESYIADHGAWVCILTAERYKTGEVTHWMPIPQPPKGE